MKINKLIAHVRVSEVEDGDLFVFSVENPEVESARELSKHLRQNFGKRVHVVVVQQGSEFGIFRQVK